MIFPPFEKGGSGGDFSRFLFGSDSQMLHYDSRLKSNSRQLRCSLTDSEALMWFKLRRKQILGVQFYRQKPIGNYIVDFYAPDGSQHFLPKQRAYDSKREIYLKMQGLTVIRFHNLRHFSSHPKERSTAPLWKVTWNHSPLAATFHQIKDRAENIVKI